MGLYAVALVETSNKKNMKREILIKVVIDWNDYEDTCDELILEDSGIYENLKDGVSIELNKHDVMQRSELFKKRCSNCGVDELFTKDDYCNCCGAKQVSFFK